MVFSFDIPLVSNYLLLFYINRQPFFNQVIDIPLLSTKAPVFVSESKFIDTIRIQYGYFVYLYSRLFGYYIDTKWIF